jgi:hypothetical protein
MASKERSKKTVPSTPTGPSNNSERHPAMPSGVEHRNAALCGVSFESMSAALCGVSFCIVIPGVSDDLLSLASQTRTAGASS